MTWLYIYLGGFVVAAILSVSAAKMFPRPKLAAPLLTPFVCCLFWPVFFAFIAAALIADAVYEVLVVVRKRRGW